jgi:hypothetical protein
VRIRSALALLIAVTPRAMAQGSGQAELSIQGYYLGISPQPVSATSGGSLKFQDFFPNFGLLNGSFEAYRSEGDLYAGDSFLEARELRWRGMHWNVTAGDFRNPSGVLVNPFSNFYLPEISGRGFRLEVSNSRRQFAVFFGKETSQVGPRIPFRVSLPQYAGGFTFQQKFGRLETGLRWLHLFSTPQQILERPNYFPSGRAFTSSDNLTAYATYRFSDHFRWYGEATLARANTPSGPPGSPPLSFFSGPAYVSKRLTVRLNYASLSDLYLPVAGQLAGDRRGPFGEIYFRPIRRIELFASGSRYRTIPYANRQAIAFDSRTHTAGLSVQLPLGFSASGQISGIRLISTDPQSAITATSENRQLTGTVTKRIFFQNLRFTVRDLNLLIGRTPSRQKAQEFEDIVSIRWLTVGAAVRRQQSITTDRRDSVFVRGVAGINRGRVSIYANVESGRDLVNQTLFATSTSSTSTIAASVRISRHWSASAEAFRSRSLSELSPASQFVLATQGIGVDPVLNRFKQWSVLVKVSRSFKWGSGVPTTSNLHTYAAAARPLTGSITGFVKVMIGEKMEPVPDVAISIESGRTVTTDKSGMYLFEEVPEGIHEIKLNMEQLPAEYNPGENTRKNIRVEPRKTVRTDFDVEMLSTLTGAVVPVQGTKFESLENIVVRLEPGNRLTSTRGDGSFGFYNLPAADYVLEVAQESLPPESRLLQEFKRPVSIRAGVPPPPARYDIERMVAPPKPTRKVLEIQIGPGKLPR